MNQEKIGKFIAEKRKERNLTQRQLAEKLIISDKAVSKWENGKCMPDVSIMLDLCQALNITVNELLSGEVIIMDDYRAKSEEMLLEMAKQKEEKDKLLLKMEIVAGFLGIIPILFATLYTNTISLAEWKEGLIVLASVIPFLIVMPLLLKIEQKAGYYECKECGHRYIPSYKNVFWATHMGRTKKMKCPECNQKSWHKKVLTKD